jgi:uncharacterized protein (TIGR02217 family)
MAVVAQRFDEDIERGAEGGHGHFKTGVVVGDGGFEDRNQEWEDARGKWTVSRALELTGKHGIARRLFYKCRGRLHDFLFKDWHDFIVSRDGDDRGRLTGSGTTWQINKVYGADEPTFEYVRPLYRIRASTLQVWRDGALQTLTTHYTLNASTGVITSTSSWAGSTLEVACEFDVLCHFEFDEFIAKLAHRLPDDDRLWKWERIQIVETREGTPA